MAESIATIETSDVYDSTTNPDIVNGWNIRRKSNNQTISSLVPFVQLIGIFNPSEYDKIFASDSDLQRRKVWYSDTDEDALTSLSSLDNGDDNLADRIEKEIQERFINLYILQSTSDVEAVVERQNAIMMAEQVSQTQDHTGGVGISDLQVEYGKSNQLGARVLKMRIVVNDVNLLNDRLEYAKLSTLQGEFMVLHGWANPQIIPGFNSTPPPILKPDLVGDRMSMAIPTYDIDTGGYWSAAKVRLEAYDFSFNEVGQLEVALTLRDAVSSFLATTRISAIANTWRKLMGTYDYDPNSTGGTPGANFSTLQVKTPSGQIVSLATAAQMEQASYFNNTTAQTFISNLTNTYDGHTSLFDAVESLNESLPYTGQSGDQNNSLAIEQMKASQAEGYPNAVGISLYEKITRYVPVDPSEINDLEEGDEDRPADDPDTPEDEGISTKPVTDYKATTVYYYLGWVLDGIKLSLNESNMSRVVANETPIIPKFAYLNNTDDSKISSAFQSQLNRTNNAGIERRIQDAIIRLKERCMPPWAGARANDMRLEVDRGLPDIVTNKNSRIRKEQYFPCRGQAIFNGPQTPQTIKIAAVMYPTPYGAPVEMPFRGHIIQAVNLGDSNNQGILSAYDNEHPGSSLAEAGRDLCANGATVSFFVPDWYQYLNEDGSPSGGSTEGFDPFNPTDYMAADRDGKFYFLVNTTIGPRRSSGWPTLQNVIKSTVTALYGRKSLTFTKVIEVDAYRQANIEIWNGTQRKWHNYYIEYLGAHFENLIRNRIGELQREGREVEDIYDEPVDLDFLTSKLYRNSRFSAGRKNKNRFEFEYDPKFPGLPTFKSNLASIRGLLSTIETQETRIGPLQDQKKEVEDAQFKLSFEIEDKITQIEQLQTRPNKTILDGEAAGIEQLTGGRYCRNAFDINGNPREVNLSVTYAQAAGNIKIEVIMGIRNWYRY